MPTTVNDEMPDDERRQRMLHGLKAGSDDTVMVSISHLAQCVGMDKAEKLRTGKLVETQELVRSPFSSTPQLRRTGNVQVNREATIKAIEEHSTKPEPKKQANQNPAKPNLES